MNHGVKRQLDSGRSQICSRGAALDEEQQAQRPRNRQLISTFIKWKAATAAVDLWVAYPVHTADADQAGRKPIKRDRGIGLLPRRARQKRCQRATNGIFGSLERRVAADPWL